MNFTISEENYIKAIYHLQTKDGKVTTNALAEKLQTKAASVTDMMKKLDAKKLALYSNTKLEPAIHLYKKYGFREVLLDNSEYERSNIKMELAINRES